MKFIPKKRKIDKKSSDKNKEKIEKNPQIDTDPILPNSLSERFISEESLLAKVGSAIGRPLLHAINPHAARHLDRMRHLKAREKQLSSDKAAKLQAAEDRKKARQKELDSNMQARLAGSAQAKIDKENDNDKSSLARRAAVAQTEYEKENKKKQLEADREQAKKAKDKAQIDSYQARDAAKAQEKLSRTVDNDEIKLTPEQKQKKEIEDREKNNPNGQGLTFHVHDSSGKLLASYRNKSNAKQHLLAAGDGAKMVTNLSHIEKHTIHDENGEPIKNKGGKGRPDNFQYSSRRQAEDRLKLLQTKPEYANKKLNLKSEWVPLEHLNKQIQPKVNSPTIDAAKEDNANKIEAIKAARRPRVSKPKQKIIEPMKAVEPKKIEKPKPVSSVTTHSDGSHVIATPDHEITVKPRVRIKEISNKISESEDLMVTNISKAIKNNYDKYIENKLKIKVKDGKVMGTPVVDDKETDGAIERKFRNQIKKLKIDEEKEMSDLYKFKPYGSPGSFSDVPPGLVEAYTKIMTDSKISEDAKKVEQERLDELSKETLMNYKKKAVHQAEFALNKKKEASMEAIKAKGGDKMVAKDKADFYQAHASKRIDGIKSANDRMPMNKKAPVQENNVVYSEDYGDGIVLETKDDIATIMFDHGIEKINVSNIREY